MVSLGGLRSREVLSLKLQDVSLLAEEMRVWGKGDKDRVLPIAPYVRRALRSYLDREHAPRSWSARVDTGHFSALECSDQ